MEPQFIPLVYRIYRKIPQQTEMGKTLMQSKHKTSIKLIIAPQNYDK